MIRRLVALVPADAQGAVRGYLALVVAGSLLRAAGAVTLVPLVRELFSGDPGRAWPWVGLLTVLTVAGWIVDLSGARRGMAVGRALMVSLLDRLVDRLDQVPLGWITAERATEARRLATTVAQTMFSGLSNLITPVLTATIVPYAIAVLLLPISWPVGLVALAAAPLLGLARRTANRLARAADRQVAEAAAEVDGRVVEFARVQPLLRATGRAGAEGSALDDAIAADQRAGLRLLGWSIPGQLVFTIASQLALLALAAVTVSRWSAGDLSGPETIAVFVVIVRYLETFTELADVAPAIETMAGTVDRVTTLLDAPSLPIAADPVRLDATVPPAVELRDVRFERGGQRILDDLTLEVPAGAITAIVGPSGAGKSTILSLIARFHDVDGGEVRVGGHDVRALAPDSLLGALGIVFQDVYLFEGTVEDNLRHGRRDASDEDLHAAARAARVDEIVDRLPDGWATRVGEGGATLSGGERQRISIARALLKDAPLLLLDEATSAIDTENEAAVLDALADDGRPRTVVIVAHRERSIARADHVVFVEDGRVVETGRPADLIAAGGRFAGYWQDRQASRDWTLVPDDAG